MVYSEAAHKYFLKAFYKWTNKKKYKAQILKHNIRHTNTIAIIGKIFFPDQVALGGSNLPIP